MEQKSPRVFNLGKAIIVTISSFFYVGYLPFVPGTFGSLAGLLVFFLVKGNELGLIFLTCIFTAIGLLVTGRAERIWDKKDCRFIVIDEVSGMLISLMFLPYDAKIMVVAFLLFRILDTFKPYPAFRLQSLKGGLGIMSDDIVAGLYTNMIIQIALRLVSFKIS